MLGLATIGAVVILIVLGYGAYSVINDFAKKKQEEEGNDK